MKQPIYNLSECLPSVQDMIKKILEQTNTKGTGIIFFTDFGIRY